MIEALVNQLYDAGVYLSVVEGKLKAKFESGGLSEENKKVIAEHKAAIIEYINQNAKNSPSNSLGNSNTPFIKSNSLRSPLSFAQKRLWFIEQLNDGQANYNLQDFDCFEGSFREQYFLEAIETIASRQKILKTVIKADEGVPYQEYDENCKVIVNRVNLINQSDSKLALEQLFTELSSQSFLLEKESPLKVTVVTISQRSFLVVYTTHHIASDKQSMNILKQEIRSQYLSLLNGSVEKLESLSVQYADYANWQDSFLNSTQLSKQLAFWQQYLAEAPFRHRLPFDFERPNEQSYCGDAVQTQISGELFKRIKLACGKYQLSTFMLLHTMFGLLLSRLSGESNVLIGVPTSGRNHKDLEPIIGFFVNSLVSRVQVEAEDDFTTLIKRNRISLLSIFENQDVPFELLVEQFQPERNLSINPMFQVMFQLQHSSKRNDQIRVATEFDNVTVNHQSIKIKTDLELHATESTDSIKLNWLYSVDLFERKKIEMFARCFNVLLENILNDNAEGNSTEVLVNQVPILDDEQVNHLYWVGQGIKRNLPKMGVHQLFEQSVKDNTYRTALVGKTSYSYLELSSAANRLARAMLNSNLKAGDVVALIFERNEDVVVALLAALKIGAVVLPIDAAQPSQRIDYMLKDSQARGVITNVDSLTLTVEHNLNVFLYDDEFKQSILTLDSVNLALTEDLSEHLAYIIYTSGSSGTPKGVMVGHDNLVNFCLADSAMFGYLPGDKFLHIISMSFDPGVGHLLSALISGVCIYFQNPSAELSAFMLKHNITHTAFPAALLAAQHQIEIPSLKFISVGGEKASSEIIDFWRNGRQMLNFYGPTEATVTSTYHDFNQSEQSNIIGRPIQNSLSLIFNQFGALQPLGCVGELWIGGAGVAKGYLNNDSLTAAKFVCVRVNSHKEPQRFYRSGDLVVLDQDKRIRYLGRIDNQVKIRGLRIELEEIEQAILNVEQVKDAVVCTFLTPNQENALVSFVQSELDKPDDIEQLIKFRLSAKLPSYMIPERIVAVKEFPMTTNGKIDKNQLLKQRIDIKHQSIIVEPSTEIEEKLLKIWQALLNKKAISIKDNFFSVGGHSLLIMRLISEINRNFSVKLSVKDLFINPTIESQAGFILGVQESESSQLTESVFLQISSSSNKNVFCYLGLGMSSASLLPFAMAGEEAFNLFVSEFEVDQAMLKRKADLTFFIEQNVQQILAIQPLEEIVLLGHSIGGIFASEIASALKVLGRKVRVVLVDAFLNYFSELEKLSIEMNSSSKFARSSNQDDASKNKKKKSVTKNANELFEDEILLKKVINLTNYQHKMLVGYKAKDKMNLEVDIFFAEEGLAKEIKSQEDIIQYYKNKVGPVRTVSTLPAGHLSVFGGQAAILLAKQIGVFLQDDKEEAINSFINDR